MMIRGNIDHQNLNWINDAWFVHLNSYRSGLNLNTNLVDCYRFTGLSLILANPSRSLKYRIRLPIEI